MSLLLSLPTHLLHEIILLLPLKDVSSCKLVCKQLLNLVLDPNFADLHLYKSQSRPHLLYRYLDTLYLFNLQCDEAPNHLRAITLWSGFKVDEYMASSCNGLVCSYATFFGRSSRDKITVCNPILRETITLPEVRNCNGSSRLAIGFDANKHYKVLSVVFHEKLHIKDRSSDPLYDYEARIYIIGGAAATWRSIGPAPFCSHSPGKSMDNFVNGAIHWFDVVRWVTSIIHAFDFDTEQFSVIPTSEKMDINLCYGIQFGVFKEWLAVSGFNHSLDRLDVWVMEEYGVKESWTKLYSVMDANFTFMECDPPRIIRPVKTLPGGEVLVMPLNHFVSYDIKSMPSHILEAFPQMCWMNPHVFAVVLTPSLVSLKHIANQEDVENLL